MYIVSLSHTSRSGRASDSVARGRGFETYPSHVVSLSRKLYSQNIHVIPRKRWLCHHMTEKMLTGILSLITNVTNVERQTQEREVGGSILTKVALLCP